MCCNQKALLNHNWVWTNFSITQWQQQLHFRLDTKLKAKNRTGYFCAFEHHRRSIESIHSVSACPFWTLFSLKLNIPLPPFSCGLSLSISVAISSPKDMWLGGSNTAAQPNYADVSRQLKAGRLLASRKKSPFAVLQTNRHLVWRLQLMHFHHMSIS